MVLVWAVATLLAIMPGVSMALAVPVGAFSRVFMHVHALKDHAPHEHVFVHDHGDGHEHEHADHDHGETLGDDGNVVLHVHYDVACPSGLVPVQVEPIVLHRLSARLSVPAAAEPPDAEQHRLLRPPI
jgi:hypothetical protein